MNISIVIPTFKRYDKLKRAISSVLNQTYKNWELIVIDDNFPNSEDREYTISIMDNYKKLDKIKYIKHDFNRGGCAARNTGIKHAKHRYIAFLDDDDEWTPYFLENMIKKISEIEHNTNEPFLVYCDLFLSYNDLIYSYKKTSQKHEGYVYEKIAKGWSPPSTSLFVVSKTCFENEGLFDEKLVSFQDYDMWLRLSKKYKFYYLDQKLLIKHQFEGEQISINPDIRLNGYNMLYEKWEDRLREDIGEESLLIAQKQHLSSIYKNYMIKHLNIKDRVKATKYLKELYKIHGKFSEKFARYLFIYVIGSKLYFELRKFKWLINKVDINKIYDKQKNRF